MMIFKILIISICFFLCELDVKCLDYDSNFDVRLKSLSSTPQKINSNSTEIWKHVYSEGVHVETVKKKILDSYENFPLVTSYKKISSPQAHITLSFKCQDSRQSRHHAGLVIEFIKNSKIQSVYYDLASKSAANGETSQKSSGEVICASGMPGDYKVRRLGADFIIEKFLWASATPHNEVEYYAYKSYVVNLPILSSLKERLDSDFLKDVFPYTYTGKWNNNCITYIAQALQDAGVIKQTLCYVYYDADWLKSLTDSDEKGEEFKAFEKSKYSETLIISDEMQEKVIEALIELMHLKK